MDEDSLANEILKIYEPYLSISTEYNKAFNDLIKNIIFKNSEGSFPLQYKLFYGFMASSTIGCEILLDDFIRIYSALGGDKSWIEKGLECENIPEHVRGMATINNILAHKPWVMDWRHLAPFKKDLAFFLFQSAMILTTIQRLASIISILNLLIDNDEKKEDKKIEPNKKTETETETEKEKIKDEKKEKDEKDEKIKDIKDKAKDKKNEVKKKNRKEKHEEQIQKVISSIKKKNTENKENENEGENTIVMNKKFQKYISELIVSYSDFNPHIIKYLSTEDFSWIEETRIYFSNSVGKDMDYLDKEIKILESLNSDTIKNNIKINIFNLKEAIEKYISLIFGIKDEEYNYHNNNESLTVELKRIIKKIACYPGQIQEQDLANCLKIINKEELIYLVLLVTSAKQKTSLTFFAKVYDDFRDKNL